MKSYLATARWRVTENAAFFRQRLNRELRGDQELKLSSVFIGISAFTSFARIISFWLAIVDLFGIMSLSLHRGIVVIDFLAGFASTIWFCYLRVLAILTASILIHLKFLFFHLRWCIASFFAPLLQIKMICSGRRRVATTPMSRGNHHNNYHNCHNNDQT